MKVHVRSCNYVPDPQKFTGTCAAKKVSELKLCEVQKQKVKVVCEGKGLKNTFIFKYLGSLFAADGDEKHDVQCHTSLALSRM